MMIVMYIGVLIFFALAVIVLVVYLIPEYVEDEADIPLDLDFDCPPKGVPLGMWHQFICYVITRNLSCEAITLGFVVNDFNTYQGRQADCLNFQSNLTQMLNMVEAIGRTVTRTQAGPENWVVEGLT